MQRSYYLMREIGRQHEMHVIAFRQHAHQSSSRELGEAINAISEFSQVRAVLDLPQDQLVCGRINLALRALLPGMPYTIRWGQSGGYKAAVQLAVRDFRPEIVHFDTISLAPYIDLLEGIPAVLNHHNIESDMLLRRAKTEPSLVKRLYFWQEGRRLAAYEKKIVSKFKKHLVCSSLDGERFMQNVGSANIHVIPNGVDLEYFQPAPHGIEVEPASLIFVGGLSWYPNASAIRFFLREVWPIISARVPVLKFRVIGRHPPKDILNLTANDTRIEFLGFIDDIRTIVQQSTIYVCPIFDGGGTKLKMLDAMALGKAIVAHPIACEGLNIRNEQHVLQASNAEEFSSQIYRLLNDDGLRKTLGARARAHVEQYFSYESIGAELCQVYEQTCY